MSPAFRLEMARSPSLGWYGHDTVARADESWLDTTQSGSIFDAQDRVPNMNNGYDTNSVAPDPSDVTTVDRLGKRTRARSERHGTRHSRASTRRAPGAATRMGGRARTTAWRTDDRPGDCASPSMDYTDFHHQSQAQRRR